MNAKSLIKLIEEHGWYEVWQRGSHKIYKHKRIDDTIAIAYHGKKDIPIGTLNREVV